MKEVFTSLIKRYGQRFILLEYTLTHSIVGDVLVVLTKCHTPDVTIVIDNAQYITALSCHMLR